MSYQELRTISPIDNEWVVRHDRCAPSGHVPGTVENEEPHCRSQRLGQELVSETGEMRMETRT